MRYKQIEDSQIIHFFVICNDICLALFCYWLSYAIFNGLELATCFTIPLKVFLLIVGLCVMPAFFIAPPIFFKRLIHSDNIVSRVLVMSTIHLLLVLSIKGILFYTDDSTKIIFLGYVLFTIALICERLSIHFYLRKKRHNGRNQRVVIFVGHPWNLEDLYETLKDSSLGYRIEGIFTRKTIPPTIKLKNLGDRSKVIDYLKTHPNVTDLYIVPDEDYLAETASIYKYCENNLIRFYVLPVFIEFMKKRMVLKHIGMTPVLSVRNEPLQDLGNRIIKRMFDIVVSSLFLLTFFPIIFLIVAIIIKHQSPGPIIFKQKRNGLDGSEFYCLKFRSMHVNADADKLQATENDPRKFKFGDFMRRTNIDELPQFINVFLGTMSIVGPRPHMLLHTQEYSKLISNYMVRHWVKPGITGWAQSQGFRGETKTLEQMENRVKADIWYVENWTFFLDLRIIWRTAMNMIHHNEKNAY